jgi:hypothetical protein
VAFQLSNDVVDAVFWEAGANAAAPAIKENRTAVFIVVYGAVWPQEPFASIFMLAMQCLNFSRSAPGVNLLARLMFADVITRPICSAIQKTFPSLVGQAAHPA